MDKSEKILRLLSETFVIIICAILLTQILPEIYAIFLSFLLIHTLNWIINCQFFALFKKFDWVHTEIPLLEQYINDISIRSTKEKSISKLYMIGSYARNELKNKSDIDLRIIRQKGLINALMANLFASRLRICAFFKKIPLDLYVIDSEDSLYKKGIEEEPRKLYSNE